MPANMPPWSIKLWIYPGGNPAGDPADWGNHSDISTYIRHPGQDGGQAITYSGGKQNESPRVDPGQMDLTLDNRTGIFSTHNPNSTYYPDLDRGTPIRLGVQSGQDSFNRAIVFPGWGTATSGNTWSNTDANLSTNGTLGQWASLLPNTSVVNLLNDADSNDVDVTCVCSVPVIATGAPFIMGVVIRYTDSDNYYLFRCEFSTLGTMSAKISKKVDGVFTSEVAILEPLSVTYSANERIKVRCQADGSALRLKIWEEATTEPEAWTITGEDDDLASGRIGVLPWRYVGNTNAGTIVLSYDDFTVTAIEFTGSVVQWPVRWNMRSTNCWAPIRAAGVLRRLQQGTGTLRSPLARQLGSYGPTGWWTLEDDTDATSLAAETVNTRPAQFVNVSPAGDSSLVGASNTVTLTANNGAIRGSCPTQVGGTGFSAMFFTKFSTWPASKTTVATFTGTSGLVRRWVISIDASSMVVEGYEADGTVVVNNSALVAPRDPLEWVAWQLETQVVGANTEWAFIGHQVGEITYYAQSGSYASTTVSRINSFVLGGGSLLNGCAFSHVWIGPNTLPFVADSFSKVSSGHDREPAMTRLARLADEENLRIAIEPSDTESELMGPQRTGNLLDALLACAEADYGVLYESGSGLGCRPRAARYRQAVLIDLVVADGEISQPPEPINDDQRVRNDWTVSRDGGSYARVIDQDHIDRQGRYDDSTSINVSTDGVLIHHAGWRVYMGTQRELRWPGIVLDFARNRLLLPYWRSRGFAPRIQVTTGLSQVASADPDVIAEGFSASLAPSAWTVSLNCAPAKPWDVWELDSGEGSLSLTGFTITEDLTTTETDVSVLCEVDTFPPTATEPASVPFGIIIGGEEMTVTNVVGATTSQTLTVTRSVNGIVKTHSNGASGQVSDPIVLAL